MTVRIFTGDQRVTEIAGDDRGLAYGDGVFETLLVDRGQPVWWQEHWARLERGANVLGIPCPDSAQVFDECNRLIDGSARAVLKIQLTRGSGARGYATSADNAPTWVLSLHAPPTPPPEMIALRWCRTMLAVQPALAGIKHCNRLEQILARAEWRDPDIFDGLVCDTEGRVISATSANLFARIDGIWRTPTLQRCGVAGIARDWLLRRLVPVEQSELAPADIETADAVFICNAVRGILPVDRLGARRWSRDAGIDDIRRRLAAEQPAFTY